MITVLEISFHFSIFFWLKYSDNGNCINQAFLLHFSFIYYYCLLLLLFSCIVTSTFKRCLAMMDILNVKGLLYSI